MEKVLVFIMLITLSSFGAAEKKENDPIQNAFNTICDSSITPEHCESVLKAYTMTIYMGAYLDSACEHSSDESFCEGKDVQTRETVRRLSK